MLMNTSIELGGLGESVMLVRLLHSLMLSKTLTWLAHWSTCSQLPVSLCPIGLPNQGLVGAEVVGLVLPQEEMMKTRIGARARSFFNAGRFASFFLYCIYYVIDLLCFRPFFVE